jgi:hypothetical protein
MKGYTEIMAVQKRPKFPKEGTPKCSVKNAVINALRSGLMIAEKKPVMVVIINLGILNVITRFFELLFN